MMRPLKALLVLALAGTVAAQEDTLTLTQRQRVETSKGSGLWHASTKRVRWNPAETAIVVCDMWATHWCKGATNRVAQMAPRMNEVISAARKKGVLIVHCPSGGLGFYANTVQRELAQDAPKAKALVSLQRWCHLDKKREEALPIDDSDGGCDCDPPCKGKHKNRMDRHQIAQIKIEPGDAITDSAEAYHLMEQKGIKNVIVMGVHTNMCVLGRPFSIRQLTYQGKNVMLMRDMTDTMYNSRKAPFVSHFTGTDLVVEHIEKYWGPTITSVDLVGGREFRFEQDTRPHLVIVVAESEYKTKETLPEFALKELGKEFRVSFVHANEKDRNDLPGIEILKEADLALFSVRRRTPPARQLDVIRKFVADGKPLVAIRTSSHAFALRKSRPPAGHEQWKEFDNEILGGNYNNHYGNKLAAQVRIAAGAEDHPILTGVPSGDWSVRSSLYKASPLGKRTTLLMTGRVEGQSPEPVAWTNARGDGGRVFYTSLGHPEDFKIEAFRRLLKNGISWAAGLPIEGAKKREPKESRKPSGSDGALSPSEAHKRITIPDDLELDLVLAEPVVRQPLRISFDERGRMWVVQYLQYPYPAGLKVLSRDRHWRIVYDKVPPPPPNHFRGADKITIHEDTDGDGVFDKHKTFLEGLSIATAVARGRGGVWVLNPPYLLFYPDKDNDDVPDGEPVVHLEGFGLEDTHSVVNNLRWGPDGWLYAAQGSTVMGAVRRTGLDKESVNSMGQHIWRYHPETRRYEIFAEGGGNAHGVEFDEKGRVYSGHNGGDTRGFHYMQGAYLRKNFGKHGDLSNPYAFGHFRSMKHHKVPRFTHTFVLYDGGALPDRYDGRLFGVAPVLSYVVISEFQPDGSTFKTYDVAKAMETDDKWFRPVNIAVGPDGAIYVADFYERKIGHTQHFQHQIDKSNGRIYRLRAKGGKSSRPFDLGAKTTRELVGLLGHKNKWFRQTALRLIGDRNDRSVIPMLEKKIAESAGQDALEAFWALHLSGGLTDEMTLKALEHSDPHVRLWTVRIACDDRDVVPSVARKFAEMARTEPNVEVRAQLACSARRLPSSDGLPVIRGLLSHDEDADDPRLPLLLWWAIETNVRQDTPGVVSMLEDKALWKRPIVTRHLLDLLMRRYARTGKRKDLRVCARLFRLAPDAETRARLMAGFEEAFKGRSLSRLPDELVEALGKGGGSVVLGVRRGLEDAVEKACEIAADEKADRSLRLQVVRAFGEVAQPSCVPILLKVVGSTKNEELRMAALTSLQSYRDPEIGARIVKVYTRLSEEAKQVARTLLTSRAEWALQLVRAVGEGTLKAGSVPLETVRRIRLYASDEIQSRVRKHWGDLEGATTEVMQKEIRRLIGVLRDGAGDPYRGKKLYLKICGKCHTLFENGGTVGPDLTPYQRDDVETVLVNVVNPSAEIREGFENHLVLTKDGRRVSGFLVEKDEKVLVLRGSDGQNVVLAAGEIDRMKVTGTSIMPEGLLRPFDDKQVRDLFSYLRTAQPLNDR